MNITIYEICVWYFWLSGITGLLIQMRISRLYLYIVHDIPIESLFSVFFNITMAHRDIKQVGFEQMMISYIPFNGVIEPEFRIKGKEDKIKERGRLCILFFVFTFTPIVIVSLLVEYGILKEESSDEGITFLQSLLLGFWG